MSCRRETQLLRERGPRRGQSSSCSGEQRVDCASLFSTNPIQEQVIIIIFFCYCSFYCPLRRGPTSQSPNRTFLSSSDSRTNPAKMKTRKVPGDDKPPHGSFIREDVCFAPHPTNASGRHVQPSGAKVC